MSTLARQLAAAALALTGCAAGPAPDEPIAVSAPDVIASSGPAALSGGGTTTPPLLTARDALDQLPVRGRGPKTGYDRDRFTHWSDWDGDGCDTRSDILRRDALPGTATYDDGCVVGAVVLDPYTGAEIIEHPGPASAVDVEHVVALSDAWQKGAAQWTPERREEYANDPLNLMAVSDVENQAHGDGDAATWLPPRRDYWCGYVARQIAVKVDYNLSVTAPERDAMVRVLDRCPNQPLPTREETRP